LINLIQRNICEERTVVGQGKVEKSLKKEEGRFCISLWQHHHIAAKKVFKRL